MLTSPALGTFQGRTWGPQVPRKQLFPQHQLYPEAEGADKEPRPHLSHVQGLQPGHTRCPVPTEAAAGRAALGAGVRPQVRRPLEGPNLFAATAPDATSGPGQPEG